jgi:hypothetical protein
MAKTVAVKLKQDELAKWIEHEMNGYGDNSPVPEYRRLHARVQWFNSVRGWCPLIGGDHMVDYGGSMGAISALIAGDGDLVSPAPMKLVRAVSEQVGFQVDVRKVISRAHVEAILDAVRNTIHDWALRLEMAGIHGEGLSFSDREAEKAQSVVVNIGSIGNATGIGAFGNNATITASQSINANEFVQQVKDLVSQAEKALPTSGLSKELLARASEDLKDLKTEAAKQKPDVGKLRIALESLQRTMEGAAGNLIASGVLHWLHLLLHPK